MLINVTPMCGWPNHGPLPRPVIVPSRRDETSSEGHYTEVCEGKKMPEYLTVARVSALPPGMGTVVTVKGQELAVFNLAGKFHAMDNRCPHQDYPLGMSPIFDNSVVCIGHAWRFNIASGECSSVPGVRVRTYEVIIEGDEVKIQDDAIPDQQTMRR